MGIRFLLRPSFLLVSKTYILAGLVGLSSAALQGQINFHKPDFDTGTMPISMATVDLNHDGLLDVVTANARGNTISVLLSDGHGSFTPHTDYPVGTFPVAVIAADFNNDGVPDIAVANNNSNTVSIFLGNGNGTLRAGSTMAVGKGPDALAAGDFNGDGKLDLAVLNQNDGTLGIYSGRGDGTFAHAADYTVGSSLPIAVSPGALVAADFNHDGKLDLAAANGNSPQVFLLLGKGDGSFVSTVAITLVGGVAVGPMAAADFNQDGNLDLLIQSQLCDRGGCFGPLIILGGNGDGTFDQGHPLGVNDAQVPLTVADINGDNVPDIVTTYRVFLVDPATIFTTAPHILPMPPSGLTVLALAAGDFNGDGKIDVLTANSGDDTISLLFGNGDGSFHQPLRYSIRDEPNSIVAADFNGDGVPDIAVGQSVSVGIQIFIGNPDGTLKPPVEIAADMQVLQLGVADINHDGLADLVATGLINNASFIRVLLSRGDGTFSPPIDRLGSSGTFLSLALADFNGDGIPDVATLGGISNGLVGLNVFLGNGDGTLRPPIGTTLGADAEGIAVADFNHDGKMDVVVGRLNPQAVGNLGVFLGNGDGTFRAPSIFSTTTFGVSLVAADFNHDGMMDFVALPDLFLGNGDGTFRQIKNAFNVGQFNLGGFLQVGDMNGDGLPDLVSAEGFRLAVIINNGDGTFQPPVSFPAGGAGQVALADFDSDGHLDIAAAGGTLNHTISLLLNAGAASPARDFQFALSPQSLTLAAGQSASAVASITHVGTFNDQVAFSCAGLPAHAACSFVPAPSSGPTLSYMLTISTQAVATARLAHGLNGAAAFAFALPVFGLIVVGSKARRKWRVYAVVAPVLAGLLLLAGCGSVNHTANGTAGTPPGTYSVTVNASGGSPLITHSQTLTLKVQ